ncbi:barstar family protein [Micromonospora sp. NPDC049679]|uniref:barstar family protein n=1 Tax=Micromonospora sp. NPDC049679 TaxID=3155920 RepID=UPI00341101EA
MPDAVTPTPAGQHLPSWLRMSTSAPPAHATVVGGRASRTRPGLFAEWAGTLSFPDYFGHNWDALADVLTDRVQDGGLTIVVDNAEHLLRDEPPAQLTTLLELLGDVARGDPATLCVILRAGAVEEDDLRERVIAALSPR